jgi:uncharacterized protein (TIGR03435 family)
MVKMTVRLRALVIVLLSIGSIGLEAQGAPATAGKVLALDVISVRPDANEDARMGLTGDGLTARGASLHWLLTEAFQVNGDQLAGEPSWSTSALWAIDAKVVGEDVPLLTGLTMAQRLGMYQQILADRFGLKYHHEQRERPTYALVVAKGGGTLTASNAEIVAQATKHPGRPGNLQMGPGAISGEGTTMHFLAIMLSRQLGRTVVDQTGLTGRYDFKLTWTPEDAAVPRAPTSLQGRPCLQPFRSSLVLSWSRSRGWLTSWSSITLRSQPRTDLEFR